VCFCTALLHEELSDKAETDHQRGFTELGLGLTKPLHGNGTDGGKRGVTRVDTVGHLDREVGRYPVDLSVQCIGIPRAGNDVADAELFRAGTDFDHHTAQRVPERCVGIELVHHLVVGGLQTLLRHGRHHLGDLIGPGLGLPDERQLRFAHLHQFGAGTDQ
jgi:hypothetical protein